MPHKGSPARHHCHNGRYCVLKVEKAVIALAEAQEKCAGEREGAVSSLKARLE